MFDRLLFSSMDTSSKAFAVYLGIISTGNGFKSMHAKAFFYEDLFLDCMFGHVGSCQGG